MKKHWFILPAVCLTAFALKRPLFERPEHFPEPVYHFENNPLHERTVYLGRHLFYDPLLSKDGSISCESCHSPFSAFTHVDHALSHGIRDSVGTRNAPALMNLAWQNLFMWDGAINHLDVQALAPIAHPAEMGSSIAEVVQKLRASQKYRTLFFKAYGDSMASGEKTLKALSQFMLTLVSANSKYDQVLRGETHFTEAEQRGYILFQQHCASCHKEPLFTNQSFENNGLAPDSALRDPGRAGITKRPEDSLTFKVPTLRNIEYTYPYMHDGRFKKLSSVLNHYTKGIWPSKTLSPVLRKGIDLDANQKVDLIHFLLCLSDKQFVFNPSLQHPQ